MIVDDVSYFEEPFFQDGPVAVAVNEVTAAGATYFSAAGNDNLIDAEGHDIASWETPEFRDAGSCPPDVEAPPRKPEHCLDFDPGSGGERPDLRHQSRSRSGTLTVDLQWDEPWFGVDTDLDAYLLDSARAAAGRRRRSCVGSFEDNVGSQGTQAALRVLQLGKHGPRNGSPAGDQPLLQQRGRGRRRKRVHPLRQPDHQTPAQGDPAGERGGVTATEYPQSSGADAVGPTVYGHSGAASAIAVAAVPYTDGATPEYYSPPGARSTSSWGP